MKDKITKLLGESKGEYLYRLKTKKNLFHTTKEDNIKEKMDRFGYVKIKNCLSEYTINTVGRPATKWETICKLYNEQRIRYDVCK